MQIGSGRSASTITRSELKSILAPDFFMWATGIEDTFITEPHPKTGRRLDEYQLIQHYSQQVEDIERIASLGVRYARYGLPWYRIEAHPGRFDFSWADRSVDAMLDRGIQPIIDLVHYGVPEWLEGAFTALDYPDRVAEFAARVAERYRGRVFWYTPLNEPRITAHYCGRLGWWPPHLHGWRGFLRVLVGACRGILRTQSALRAIDPEIVIAHVDATDIYTPAEPAMRESAEFHQRICFLALDLITGRVDAAHPLRSWVLANGIKEGEVEWFAEHSDDPDVIGINLYPMYSNKVVHRGRTRMPYGDAGLIDATVRMYESRYGIPLFLSETASIGPKRATWLRDSLSAVKRLRAAGLPIVGYTWWPLFALVAWAYREKEASMKDYLLQMGLWDLKEESGALRRVETELVEELRRAVAEGVGQVGRLVAR